jgi:hypothetical protein
MMTLSIVSVMTAFSFGAYAVAWNNKITTCMPIQKLKHLKATSAKRKAIMKTGLSAI